MYLDLLTVDVWEVEVVFCLVGGWEVEVAFLDEVGRAGTGCLVGLLAGGQLFVEPNSTEGPDPVGRYDGLRWF